MQSCPSEQLIHEWLLRERPLHYTPPFMVQDLDPKPFSGHFNLLITATEGRFVLRFKGPEWGEPEGIRREYAVLHALEPYEVGPHVFGVTDDFFGEPALYMEYLTGALVSGLSDGELMGRLPAVAALIARINAIPPRKLGIAVPERHLEYSEQKAVWRERLRAIELDPTLKSYAIRAAEILPRAETMLDLFEHTLTEVIGTYGSVFTFTSAHAGHCMETVHGMRFLNWEPYCQGDPSFSLAVFIASLEGRPGYEDMKRTLIDEYSAARPVPSFRELIEYRLAEREVSNLFWVLDHYSRTPLPERSEDELQKAEERFARVEALLAQYI